MELTGKHVAVLAEDMYNEHELWYPYYRLKEAGARVTLAGTGRTRTFHSKVGLPVTVDQDVQNMNAEELDGVIIPGGYAPDWMRREPKMVALVRDVFHRGRVVAAICHAGWMLASADILRGRRATGFYSLKDDLVHAGAIFVDEEVVVDGSLITSRTPADLPAFMRAVILKLKG
jgi:protease I